MDMHKRLKGACYVSNISMALASNILPLLFIPFRNLYGISYTLLGLLVVFNFCTQLFIDILFSGLAKKFNINIVVKIMPVITIFGLAVLALAPIIFPSVVYVGLVIGTILIASACGLSEVLLSSIVSVLPSKNPGRSMSNFHSVYALGTVVVVIISAIFIWFMDDTNWPYLILAWSIIPLTAFILFMKTSVPQLFHEETSLGAKELLKNKKFLLCFICLFLGGVTEVTMSQWSSSYLENSLGIPKIWGDIFGVAMFALTLGIGRMLYGRIGKNIYKVLFFGSLGSVICYAITALTPSPVLGIITCALTGFMASMLWPGSLVAASQEIPSGGVVMFALMATAGDLGGSFGPQFLGVIADGALKSKYVIDMALQWNMSAEQLSLKIAMLATTLFPILATIGFGMLWKSAVKRIKAKPIADDVTQAQ